MGPPFGRLISAASAPNGTAARRGLPGTGGLGGAALTGKPGIKVVEPGMTGGRHQRRRRRTRRTIRSTSRSNRRSASGTKDAQAVFQATLMAR